MGPSAPGNAFSSAAADAPPELERASRNGSRPPRLLWLAALVWLGCGELARPVRALGAVGPPDVGAGPRKAAAAASPHPVAVHQRVPQAGEHAMLLGASGGLAHKRADFTTHFATTPASVASGAQSKPIISTLSSRVGQAVSDIDESELIELLAQLYAHYQVNRKRLDMYLRQSAAGAGGARPQEPASSYRELEAKFNVDEESLKRWIKERQDTFSGSIREAKFEILAEYPNRTINVCQDGPKILVLPNLSDFIYCLTQDQWIGRLWQDLGLSYYHYPIIVLNVLVFLVGTTGNVFVCLSVYRNHMLRNVTNYFIVNLAAADLLVILICLPATQVWDISLTWFFGTVPCKLIMFLQDVSVSVSVLTLTAISLDRYYAICYPLRFKSSLSQAKRIIALIWLVSLLLMSPDLMYLSAHRSEELAEAGLDTVLYSDCDYDWNQSSSKLFQFIKTVLLYFLPFVLMFWAHYVIMRTLREASKSCESSAAPASAQLGCKASDGSVKSEEGASWMHQLDGPQTARRSSSPGKTTTTTATTSSPPNRGPPARVLPIRATMHNKDKLESRRKAAKMLTAIVAIFGICYLPVHLINFLRQFVDNIPQTELTSALAMLAHCACYLNSAINPIIYNHMNSIFRAEFRKFLRSCCLGCLGSKRRGRKRRRRKEILAKAPMESEAVVNGISLMCQANSTRCHEQRHQKIDLNEPDSSCQVTVIEMSRL